MQSTSGVLKTGVRATFWHESPAYLKSDSSTILASEPESR